MGIPFPSSSSLPAMLARSCLGSSADGRAVFSSGCVAIARFPLLFLRRTHRGDGMGPVFRTILTLLPLPSPPLLSSHKRAGFLPEVAGGQRTLAPFGFLPGAAQKNTPNPPLPPRSSWPPPFCFTGSGLCSRPLKKDKNNLPPFLFLFPFFCRNCANNDAENIPAAGCSSLSFFLPSLLRCIW